MKKLLCLLTALCIATICCSCLPSPAPLPQGEEAVVEVPAIHAADSSGKTEEAPAWLSDGARPVSVWAAYWDTGDVLSELSPIADRLGILCYFEAFFDHSGALIMPEALRGLYLNVEADYPDNLWQSYITFVNDLQKEDGSFELKSAEILRPLFEDEAAMDAHIDELIGFTLSNGFDGLEIDYEALRKAPELWEPFTVFCGRLYERANAEELGLRIILEPNAPFDELSFPAGPDYVIMCYNLHGGHSDPGPKADYVFLEELMRASEYLPGKSVFALATGGYDWDENGEASQLTLRAAYQLYKERAKGYSLRDGQSGALVFRYTDEDEDIHTVYCADTRTLALWSQKLKNAGFDELCYWRLGGNYLIEP